jgi:PAS domain S-box-containing protein
VPSDARGAAASYDHRVLLLPPTRRDAEAILQLMSGTGIDCVVCPTMEALCEQVDRGVGVILVSEEMFTAEPEGLIARVRTQPVWSDFATIVLSRPGVESPTLTQIMRRAGNTSVLERPVRLSTFLSLVRSALRARSRQYEVRDRMTQLAATEMALREARQKIDAALLAGEVGTYYWDIIGDRLTGDINFLRMFGRDPGETVDTPMAEIMAAIHPDDRNGVMEAVERTLKDDAPYHAEYRIRNPKGEQWILARGIVERDVSGNAVGWAGVVMEITDRKQIEEERRQLLDSERQARSEAERASRMKDEFLATLSHELRTPLAAILGWAQVLALRSSGDAETEKGIAAIDRNARAQTRIIDDLLDMSGIISGKVRLDVQRIDLAPVVQAAVDTILPAASAKGVRVQVVLDPDAGPVSGDPNRLQQVFWNLLSNAVKFTPRGKQIQVMLARVNSHLEVSITDTGEGISAEFLPHVFDRFRQADASTTRRHGGLGLGLAIAKQLVELHGGSVEVRSPGLGEGATFLVKMPVTVVRQELLEPRVSRHPAAFSASLRVDPRDDISGISVLAVDDEPDSRALVKRLLEDRGAVVFVAESAAQAMELLKAHRPHVLISDIGMPDEDGYSLIRRVRALSAEEGSQVGAIALTAFARPEDRMGSMRAGFQMHLAKPVEAAELIAMVARLGRSA